MTTFRNSCDPQEYTVQAAVLYRTDSSFDNYGTVEQLQEQLSETRKMLAAVIDLLHTKETLSAVEVAGLVHMKAIL